jgi:hypothetical protein
MATIVLNPISEKFLDAYERYDDLLISGVTVDIPNNTLVTITLHDKTYQTSVLNNVFHVTVSGDDIILLEDNSIYTVVASVTINEEVISDSENVTIGVIDNSIIQQIHCINVIDVPTRRFTSDEEIKEIYDTIDKVVNGIGTIDCGTY